MTHLKTPRLAAFAALALASGTTVDLCAAISSPRHATNFGTDFSSPTNALNIKAEFCPHAGGAETMAAMTPEQVSTDIAVGCTAKKANMVKFTGLGTSACVNSIGIDGVGSASAPAAKKLAINDEAGVDLGASCDDGDKATMALVAAAAKKASGSARRQVGSRYVDNRLLLQGVSGL